MKRIILALLLSITVCRLNGQTVIPSVNDCTVKKGTFTIGKEVTVYADNHEAAYLSFLKNEVLNNTHRIVTSNNKNTAFKFNYSSNIRDEAYKLTINKSGVTIYASTEKGFFYAIQTIRQLIHISGDKCTLPFVEITDSPRVKFRSFMLDSGRQYQSVETIKKYIDMVILLKMNNFHWHLTEGLGWRVEIDKYPLLTQKGAFVATGKEQQGFYSKNDIKEIIKYAQERYINVMPEIDIPGHAEAALTAYPGLGCFNQKVEVPETGFTHNIMCAGKDSTLIFLKNVIDELCELFPSEYIHLGGDEAPKGNWDKCPHCKARIKNLGLKNSGELQVWLSATVAQYLKDKGRKAVFWEDIIYHDGYPIPDNVVIQWWNYRGHGDDGLKKTMEKGLGVICGTNYYNYLNFPVTAWSGYDINRTFDIKDIYLNNPSYRAAEPLVLGMNCALWTDYNVTEAMIDRRIFPRIFAIAEQMWYNGQPLPFDEFYNKVISKKDWFESKGYKYGPALKTDVPTNYSWE